MTLSPDELVSQQSALWFCLKSRPKHEHLAAAALRRVLNIECFSPRLRFRKDTRRGAVWFTEAMFPNYLFARFVYSQVHRQVQYSPGVSSIVHFGSRIAVVDDAMLADMRAASGEEEVIIFDPELRVGDPVKITEGAFRGLEALVTQLLPAKERVKVLLEFLGRSMEAEISVPKVLASYSPRSAFGLAAAPQTNK